MTFPSDVTTYTIEGAASLVLVAVAYKIYKMRIATESNCCDTVRMKTVSRGDSENDLELGSIRRT